MFTAILWDYDGTLANTPVKNIAVTRAVLGRLDPALLDPLPEALSSLAAYQAANYRCKGRLKSIFLFLVQKAPQLIKQGRSAQCQLPVLGQYSTQADRSDSVPHSGNALHFPM